jgi:E3 ubiquitin-protein ligase ATL6/9/15/31/42/55
MAAVDAQPSFSSSPPPVAVPQQTPSAPPHQTSFGRTMSTFIMVAISVFFFLLFICAYIN